MWRTVGLRGAGFPAAEILALAAPDAALAADRVLAAAAGLDEARVRAYSACRAGKDAAPPELRKRYRVALGHLAKRAPEPFAGASPEVVAAFAELARLEAGLAECTTAFEHSFEHAAVRTSEALRTAARDPRFREAVLWQNRAALHTGVDVLVRQPAGAATSKARRYERLVANYLQRYCVKNDTVGFFGPVGWAQFGARSRVAPGPRLLAARTVYFEYWAIDQVAATLAQSPDLRATLAPRRMPTVTVEGTTLRHPVDRTSELPPAFARLLASCDGERSARDLAEELCSDPTLALANVAEVFELLDELVAAKLVTWTIELPVVGEPDQLLRAALERADAGPKRVALAVLDELEARRAAIAAARGDEPALDRAFAELDASFSRITGVAPTHNEGETYGGRTLVYEDCCRAAEVELGPELRERLAPALVLLLESARWYSHEIATRYRQRLRETYAAVCADGAGPAVDYIRFWQAIEHEFTAREREAPAIVEDVLVELQRRWMQLLGAPFTGGRVMRSASALRDPVRAAFAAPSYGWPSARQHSPDLMMATERLGGEALFVLGELHVGTNTLFRPAFMKQHPRPQDLIDWMAAELPPRVASVGAKERVTRADEVSAAAFDLDLEIGSTRSRRPRARVVAIGELVVEEVAGSLAIRTRDGRHRFDPMVALDHVLKGQSLAHFRILPPTAHTPRVTIDHLVVSREQWTFPATELAFAHDDRSSLATRFVEARRWARSHGLPRFGFFKVREEPKPCFLDLDSPTYVENFARLVRKASVVHVSEMLPAPSECWLPDAEDRRYCSELRMVTVDPQAWGE